MGVPQSIAANWGSNGAAGTSPYRSVLLEKRQGILRALGLKAGAFASLDRVADEDQAQYSHDEYVSLRLNGMDYEQLRQVEEALDRIESGDYGICQACEEPIPDKRLRAVPWAKYCVSCQERIADRIHREPIRLEFQEEMTA